MTLTVHNMPARRLDGTPVMLTMTDYGTDLVARDANGNAYECYSTLFGFDGKQLWCQTDRAAIDLGPPDARKHGERFFLRENGIDPNSVACMFIGREALRPHVPDYSDIIEQAIRENGP